MKKLLILSILLLCLSSLGRAQGGNTTVTAIIRDPNGALYTNSQVNITFFDPGTPGKQPLLNGSVFQTTYTIFATDSFGRFTQSVADNGIIDSSSGTVNTQWSFRVIYSDRATSFVYRTPINCAANIPATCTAGVMDISAQLQAVAALLPAQPGGGGSFVVRGPPCATTMNFQMAGTFPTTANTAFNVNLNCNVTLTSITQAGGGNVQVGAIAQFTLIEPNVAGFSFAWPSNFIDQPTIQQGSNQTTNASFWYDGTNWHAQTFPATGGGGGAVNAAIKPTLPGDPVQYVSPNGNDANDGLSWGTAKLTVYAALKALPGGSTGVAGGGIVKVSGTVAYGGPAANQGMYIMGGADANFGSPPSGWLKKLTSAPITIECEFPNLLGANSHTPNCLMTGGGTTDLVHPAIWLSSTTGINIRGIALSNFLNTYVKIGIDSNNNRVLGGTSSITLDGLSWNHGACRFGGGPGIDIGDNSFWIWIRNPLGGGCLFGETVISSPGTPGLSRSSNVVTVTTTTPNSVVAGSYITTQFTTDPSFIGSFVVASVTDSTHFTFNQTGPNATSGDGQVITSAKAAINIDASSGVGSGLIFVSDFGLNGGIIRLNPGASGGGVYVRNGTYEGDFTSPDAPPVLVVRESAPTDVVVENLVVADSSSSTPVPGVRIDNASTQFAVVSRVDAGVQGPATVLGGTPIYGGSNTSLKNLHAGFTKAGRLTGGGIDVDRRAFSPRAVGFANLASMNPASWTLSGSGTITTGITAPDGTTNAGRLTATSGAVAFSFYTLNNTPVTIGDTYIWGLWQRSSNVPGTGLQGPGTFILNGNGFGANDQCSTWNGGIATSSALALFRQTTGDGQWIWHSGICKVISNPANAGLNLNVVLFSPQIIDAYGPVVIKVPNGIASDDELFELAANLASYPDTASVGDVTMMRGQRFSMSTPGNNFFIKHIGTLTADRTVTWPDISFTPVVTSLPQTWTANQSLSNGTQLRFFSPNGTNFTSIQGPSSNGVNVNLVLPNANSSGVQCFNNDGSGNISYSNCSGGTGTPGGADTQVQFDSTGTFGGSPNLTWISPALTVGLNATATGQVKYKGVTSGTVTTQSQDAAGSWTFKWPATAGTSGFPMVTDGTGVASWSLLGLAGGGTNSGSAAFTNTQLVGVSGGALASLTGTLTGTNPVLTLTSALTTSVPFALNTPASPTADIFDLSINGSKTSWVDNLGIWHAPSYTATGSGALVLTGTEGTCPSPAGGVDILCIGNSATHTIQSSLNGAAFKDNAQFSNSGPAAHGVCLVGSIFPQLNCTAAGTLGQAFVSQGGGADGIFATLGVVGGGTGNTTLTAHGVLMGETASAIAASAAGTAGQAFLSGGAGADGAYAALNMAGGASIISGILPIANGGTGSATLAAANIVTVTGAITPNDCVKWSSATVVTDSGGTCGGAGGSARLDQLLGGTASNTINSTIFPQFWQWALTGSTTAFKFGEQTAATGASNVLLQASTLATSTAVPFQTDNNGNGYQLNSSGLFKPIGTGAIATPGAANNLVVSRGSSTAVSYIPPVAAGKVLIDNGPGVDPSFQDPIISQAFVNLWTAQDVTTTRTSAAVRNPIFSQTGTLELTWASITGSPATCTLQIQGVDSVGNALNNGSTFSVSPANGTTSQTFTAAAALQSAAQIKAIFACGVYPSTGTLTLDFTPIPNINVTNTVAISAASLPLPTGASTSAKQPALGTAGAASADVITVQGIASMTKLLVTPDSVALPANQSVNVNQVGGTAIDTNSGNKSAGTQRVVLATDQPNLTTPLNINKAQINGVTPLMGNGVTGTGSQRVTVASDNTPFETVPVTTATTTDTTLRCTLVSAASTNATNCKASAGNIYGYRFVNTTTTIYYLRMYNLTTSPTCSSATGFIESIPIPPAGAAGQAGGVVSMQPFGEGYGTGIAFCFTGGSSSTDNTNAAVGVFGTILYK